MNDPSYLDQINSHFDKTVERDADDDDLKGGMNKQNLLPYGNGQNFATQHSQLPLITGSSDALSAQDKKRLLES
jgi:hypothetical protein